MWNWVSVVACTFQGFDVFSAYLLEGLHKPNISSSPYIIPPQNNHKQNTEIMFWFDFAYLIDDGPLILFFPTKKYVGDNIRTFVASYDFVLNKKWWGFDELSLCCPLETYLTKLLLNLDTFATLGFSSSMQSNVKVVTCSLHQW